MSESESSALSIDSFRNPDGTPAVRFESPRWQDRLHVFLWRAGFGVFLASTVASSTGSTDALNVLVGSLVLSAPFIVWGLIASMKISSCRTFSYERRKLTSEERIKAYSRWFVGFFALLAISNLADFFRNAIVALAVLMLLIGLLQALPFRRKVLTPAAKSYKKAIIRQRIIEFWRRVLAYRKTRFVIGGLIAVLAVASLSGPDSPGLAVAGGWFVLGAVIAMEAALWLLMAGLVIGLVTLVFKGIAALPLSVAVILGAVIIALILK